MPYLLPSIICHDPASVYFLTIFWYWRPNFTHTPHVRHPPLLLRRLRYRRLKTCWISSLSTASNWSLLFLFSSILYPRRGLSSSPLLTDPRFLSPTALMTGADLAWVYLIGGIYLKATGPRFKTYTGRSSLFCCPASSILWLLSYLGLYSRLITRRFGTAGTLLQWIWMEIKLWCIQYISSHYYR